MNFKYGKKEMEYLKSRDRRLGEVIDQTSLAQQAEHRNERRTRETNRPRVSALQDAPAAKPSGSPTSNARSFAKQSRKRVRNLYRLEGFAKDSETLEEMVVYRALYGEHGLWVRPAKMFFETIERDGKQMKRFEPL